MKKILMLEQSLESRMKLCVVKWWSYIYNLRIGAQHSTVLWKSGQN